MRSLRTRLALFYAAWTVLSLLTFGVAAYLVEVAAEAADDEPEEVKELELAAFRQRLSTVMAGAVPVAVLVAFAGASWMTRRTFQVVEDVVKTAEGLQLDRLDARLPSPAGAGLEVERLVDSLNGMLERLERSSLGLKRFTAGAAHELRTPLAVLMTRLEASLTLPSNADGLLEVQAETLEGLQAMSRLVDALLTLAKSDAGALPATVQPVSLVGMCQRVMEAYEEPAASRSLHLTGPGVGDVVCMTDPVLVERALANIVDNAVKYAAQGGTVVVSVVEQPGAAMVTVENAGPVLAPADLGKVFTRFHRGENVPAGVPGHGLGLELSRALMLAVGGDLRVENAGDRGVRATLVLPMRA